MKFTFTILLLALTIWVSAQTIEKTNRTIEVKGTAEIEIEPDEFTFSIRIEEYWKEEFEKETEFKDYKTKVPLSEIEDQLIKNFRKVGIDKNDVVVQGMGNYWRHQGKEFLYSKQLEVIVTDLSKINKLTQIMDSRGIKSMNIGKLNHSNLDEFKKLVKIDALKDAQNKAQYLVESLNEELGEVISITEMSDGYSRPMYSNTMMHSAEMTPESIDQIQKLKLTYQVKAIFRIK